VEEEDSKGDPNAKTGRQEGEGGSAPEATRGAHPRDWNGGKNLGAKSETIKKRKLGQRRDE
jgi:hypothetical protein